MTTDFETDRASLAAEAFIYGFPLNFDLDEVERFVHSGIGAVPATALNAFGHADALAGPDEKFVSINNDTIYSITQVDVSAGPVRLEVPDTNGRYYVLQFIDAWTDNFAYIGHRATGTGAGTFLLVASDWDGTAGDGESVIRFPTTIASIVGRWAVAGEDDLPAVRELQAALTLTPTTDAPGAGLPQPDAGVPEDLRFFEKLRVRLRAFPPAPRDQAYQQRFAALGLFEEQSPYVEPDPELAADLRAGLASGRKKMEYALEHGASPEVNGWKLTYHVFDYNLDYFEIGALDDPQWKLPDTELRYVERALSARGGLWGNHGYEAAYAMVYDDADGEALDGSRRYEIRFETMPPVDAFWSITMYDLPEFFLVENPIGRYSIGDRTPGIQFADDGSLTITIQHDAPEERSELAAGPRGPLPPHPAHVRTARRRLRRHLHDPADHPDRLNPVTKSRAGATTW